MGPNSFNLVPKNPVYSQSLESLPSSFKWKPLSQKRTMIFFAKCLSYITNMGFTLRPNLWSLFRHMVTHARALNRSLAKSGLTILILILKKYISIKNFDGYLWVENLWASFNLFGLTAGRNISQEILWKYCRNWQYVVLLPRLSIVH